MPEAIFFRIQERTNSFISRKKEGRITTDTNIYSKGKCKYLSEHSGITMTCYKYICQHVQHQLFWCNLFGNSTGNSLKNVFLAALLFGYIWVTTNRPLPKTTGLKPQNFVVKPGVSFWRRNMLINAGWWFQILFIFTTNIFQMGLKPPTKMDLNCGACLENSPRWSFVSFLLRCLWKRSIMVTLSGP